MTECDGPNVDPKWTRLESLSGERDEHTDARLPSATSAAIVAALDPTVPVMTPDRIRALPFGTALVRLRTAPPLVTDLRPWTTPNEATQSTWTAQQ